MKEKIKYLLIFSIPLICFFFSLKIGRYPIKNIDILNIFINPSSVDETIKTIIFKIRLPRILCGILIGAGLSLAGASYQGLFKNPMVSPAILGASSGAGFGASLGILLSFNMIAIQLISFLFGLIAVIIVYLISLSMKTSDKSLSLILSGIIINTLFTSLISLVKYVADPSDKLPAISFWLMGSLSAVDMNDFYILLISSVLSIIPIFLLRWRMNVMSLGDEEAKALGLNVNFMRIIIVSASSLITASAVSVAGLIGWIGLVIPHLARMIVGPDFRKLIPITIVLGASYLIIVDDISRSIFSVEIPLGILTSIIGAPFFIYLMGKNKKGWN